MQVHGATLGELAHCSERGILTGGQVYLRLCVYGGGGGVCLFVWIYLCGWVGLHSRTHMVHHYYIIIYTLTNVVRNHYMTVHTHAHTWYIMIV